MPSSNAPPRAEARVAGPDPTGLPPDMRRMESLFAFQRRTWTVERLAWLAMLGVVLAGLLGALGGTGWLSSAEATTPDGTVRITYRRMQRLLAPTVFRIEASQPGPEGRLELRLGPEFLADWRVMGLVPPPAESRSDAEGLVLTYHVEGPEAAPLLLLQAEPEAPGLARAAIGRAAAAPAVLRILVWP